MPALAGTAPAKKPETKHPFHDMKHRNSLTISLTRTVVFLGTTASALAHPGHQHPVTPPEHPLHWFIEPQHLLGWIGLACVVLAFGKARESWDERRAVARAKNPL
jgi:hypothetical protein